MGRTRERERHFQQSGIGRQVASLREQANRRLPPVPTELTADTCCAIGVHSQWCGCDAL